MRKLLFLVTLFCATNLCAQTGQCHSTSNNGASCTLDSQCTGGASPYCAVLKHIVFIVKENRSFDQFFGRFPGVTGGPLGTTASPYNCAGTAAGCTSGHATAQAVDPTGGDADCSHTRYTANASYDGGLMDKFNVQCTGWAAAYGTACSDYLTSGQTCQSNGDCTSGLCNQNTIPHYWAYAQNYGLADHFFASVGGPSYPNHLYLFAAADQESAGNPVMNYGAPPNGQLGQTWTCDSFHYGRCSNSATTLCSTSAGCSGGGTCTIDQGTGFGYYNTTSSCTKDSDLNFTLINIVGNGTTATATCATNCGSLATNVYVNIVSNSQSGFNTSFLVTGVTGTPVTSFTFASSTNATGTGGTINYDYCTNGNTYTGSARTMQDLDLLGKTGNAYVPGTCSANNTQACTCATTDNTYSVTNPCTDTSSTCAGSSNNCVPTQNIASTRGAACPNITTIADRLDAASVSWKIYNESSGELWNPVSYVSHLRYGSDWTNNVNTTTAQFITDAGNCTSDSSCSSLPSVIWLNSGYTYSEHPSYAVSTGEAWTAARVSAVMSNTYLWRHSVVFIMHDDWGGFYDHIAPSQDAQSWTNGFRVPFICVGAYCANSVNTTTFTFESLMKCVEVQYSLTAINSRDSAANDVCTSSGGMVNLSLANAPLGSLVVGASQMNKGTMMMPGSSAQ